MSEINRTDCTSIKARHFPNEGFLEADCESIESKRDNKRVEAEFSILRNYGRNKLHYCVHQDGAWIQKLQGTSLRGFGTIRQKYYIVICCIASCYMTKNLAGKRNSLRFEEFVFLEQKASTRTLYPHRVARTLLTQGQFPFAR